MSEPKHTPGPWQTTGLYGLDEWYFEGQEISGTDGLVAAAPELLTVIEEMAESDGNISRTRREQLERVIAKAKGETL